MKPETQTDAPPLSLRAELRSANPEARTVEVVFSTGAAVERFDWMTGGRYVETLSVEPGAIRLKRLNNSAPFLNSHSAFDISDVLGVIVPGTARIENGDAVATVRFSKREDAEEVWQDIVDGILRHVSVGYRVHKYEQTEGDGKVVRRHAVDWEPFEISAVPIGADDDAKVRSNEQTPTNPCVIVTRSAATVPTTSPKPSPSLPAKEPIMADANRADVVDPNEDGTCPSGYSKGDDGMCHIEERSERDIATAAERDRIQGILRGCRAARLPQSLADELIRDNVSLLDAQQRILGSLEAQDRTAPPSRQPSGAIVGGDPLANVWRGMESALLNRVAPEYFKLDDMGREYRGITLMEMARLCLEKRGFRTTGMSKMELAGYAMGLNVRGGGMHSSSDFANILADVANKTLRRAYEEAPQTFAPISRRVPMPDFKPVKRNQLGDAPALLEVKEHGEFTRGSVAEGKEQFQLATYGRVFAITRKALVNDDTDAFSRITMMFGRMARNLESDLVWAQITANANMGDGVALFHATHGNLSGTSDAIAVDKIGAGRAAMRKQVGLDLVTLLNIAPRYLIVPAAKETLADQFVSQNLLASQSSNVNPFAGRLQVIAEPRLDVNSAVSWYLAASPDQIDMIEYGFLDGEDGPMVETRVGFDVDGIEVKCRHDVAAKVIDWRGFYKNPGA